MIEISRYKKITFTALICIIIWLYFYHVIYVLYLVHIYPVKAQVKDVSMEFHGTWLPAASSESPMWFFLKSEDAPPFTMFLKIDKLLPRTQGTMTILKINDKDIEYFQSNKVVSRTMHFDWGVANILKAEVTSDPALVVVSVPEFKILIQADRLEELKEIKSIKLNK